MTNIIVPAPFTELSAINYMLSCIGEAPLSTLVGATQADVAVAINTLINVVSEVCAMQWEFNTTIGYYLQPAGQIDWVSPYGAQPTLVLNVFAVPANMVAYAINPNTLQVGTNYKNAAPRLSTIFSPGTLVFYDRTNNREGFLASSTPSLILDAAWFVDFVTMPYEAQLYCVAKASRQLIERSVNSSEIANFIKTDEAMAWRHLWRRWGLPDNYNALRTVNAIRALGNRPALNAGFIDIRGVQQPIAQVAVAPALVTVGTAILSEPTGTGYTYSFAVTNPNTDSVVATFAVSSSGSIDTVVCTYLSANIPAGVTIAVPVTYNLDGDASIELLATTTAGVAVGTLTITAI